MLKLFVYISTPSGLSLVLCFLRHILKSHSIHINDELNKKLDTSIKSLSNVVTSICESDVLFYVLLQSDENHGRKCGLAFKSCILKTMQITHDVIQYDSAGGLPSTKAQTLKIEAKSVDSSSKGLAYTTKSDIPQTVQDDDNELHYNINRILSGMEDLIRGKVKYLESIDFEVIIQRWWNLNDESNSGTSDDYPGLRFVILYTT